VTATLEAPDRAPAGGTVELRWSGPAYEGDYLTVVARGAPEGTYNAYRLARDGSPASLTMPDAAGPHELRYVIDQSSRTLASRPIELTAVLATLETPAQAPAGSEIEVHWTGPKTEGDYLTVVERGAPEGSFNEYVYADRGSPARLRLPDALGEHEVRYVIGQSARTLASAPLALVAVAATLEAPAQAQAGAEVEIHWSGPANEGDYLTIVERAAPEGTHDNYALARRPGLALVQAPDALGDHEIRYVVGQSGRTLASHPIELTAVSASLRVEGPTLPGGELAVQWAGPNLKDDFVTLVPAGAPEGAHLDYAYARRGSPARLRAPDQPGDYELRYVVGQSRRTLASLPLTLAAAEVSLSVAGPATPGGVIEVSFHGPGRYQDLVELVPAGAAADAPALRSARASQGSPLKLFAPPSPGHYELRYRLGDTGEVAAAIPLVVE
jgi:Ca-activated chloride channel family protein